jgi:GT2 family glycosyltransferase
MPYRLSVVKRDLNGGPGASRNSGIDIARGQVIALLDADTEPDPYWLTEGLKAIEGFDVAEGYTEIGSPEKVTPFTHQTQNISPGGFPTCNMFLRRSVFEKVGMFDPRFYDRRAKVHFREDTDLALRCIEQGLKVTFAREAKVLHRPLSPNWRRPIRLAMRYRHDRLLRRLHPETFSEWNDVYVIRGRRHKRIRQKLYWSYLAGIALLPVALVLRLPLWPLLLWVGACLAGVWWLHVRAMGRRALSLQGLVALPVAAVVPFVFAASIVAGIRLHPRSPQREQVE